MRPPPVPKPPTDAHTAEAISVGGPVFPQVAVHARSSAGSTLHIPAAEKRRPRTIGGRRGQSSDRGRRCRSSGGDRRRPQSPGRERRSRRRFPGSRSAPSNTTNIDVVVSNRPRSQIGSTPKSNSVPNRLHSKIDNQTSTSDPAGGTGSLQISNNLSPQRFHYVKRRQIAFHTIAP